MGVLEANLVSHRVDLSRQKKSRVRITYHRCNDVSSILSESPTQMIYLNVVLCEGNCVRRRLPQREMPPPSHPSRLLPQSVENVIPQISKCLNSFCWILPPYYWCRDVTTDWEMRARNIPGIRMTSWWMWIQRDVTEERASNIFISTTVLMHSEPLSTRYVFKLHIQCP